ncbi:substrate-binding domain-containing protein [Microbacterium sp. NPDC055683]
MAREADVSLATASRVLSGHSVRPHLRARVEDAAERLGYRPDLAAQAVARGATKTVALIVDYLRSSFGVEITRGVVDAASRHGLVVNVTGAETHPGDLLEMIASARALRPEAIVLATGRVQDPAIRDDLVRALESYQAAGGRVSIVDGLDLPFASCAFDEETAAHALCRSLVDLGYRRPLVFNSSAERRDLVGRTEALVDGFRRAGLPDGVVRLAETATASSGAASDDELVELGDADVVLCVEGAVLPGIYRHIRSRGLRVGIDVGVTAFGQYSIADALRPHLTTVMIPLRRAGELALEHALVDTDATHLSLPCNLRVRASTPRRPPRDATPGGPAVEASGASATSVGVVLPPLPDEQTGAIMRTVAELARADGVRCTFLPLPTTDGRPLSVADYDALLVWTSAPVNVLATARDRGLPFVVVDHPTALGAPELSVEVAEGMQALLEHLFSLGHESVVYLSGSRDEPAERERAAGIELFAATHREVRVRSLAAADLPAMPLERVIDDGATAVVAYDDAVAAQIARALAHAGTPVPGRVSVAGFGGGGIGEVATPAITSVRIDVAEAARSAWRLLLRAGEGDAEPRSLRARLLVRESTGPAPRG